jgi:hypothetical protein
VRKSCRVINTQTKDSAALHAAAAIVRSQCLLEDDALTIYDLDEQPFQDAADKNSVMGMSTVVTSASLIGTIFAYKANWPATLQYSCNVVTFGTISWCTWRLYRWWWVQSRHDALNALITNIEVGIAGLHSALRVIQRVELGMLSLTFVET